MFMLSWPVFMAHSIIIIQLIFARRRLQSSLGLIQVTQRKDRREREKTSGEQTPPKSTVCKQHTVNVLYLACTIFGGISIFCYSAWI